MEQFTKDCDGFFIIRTLNILIGYFSKRYGLTQTGVNLWKSYDLCPLVGQTRDVPSGLIG